MAPLRPNDLYPTQDAAILVHPATQALEDAMTTDSLRRHSGYPFANQYDGWDRMGPDGIGIFFMAHLVQWTHSGAREAFGRLNRLVGTSCLGKKRLLEAVLGCLKWEVRGLCWRTRWANWTWVIVGPCAKPWLPHQALKSDEVSYLRSSGAVSINSDRAKRHPMPGTFSPASVSSNPVLPSVWMTWRNQMWIWRPGPHHSTQDGYCTDHQDGNRILEDVPIAGLKTCCLLISACYRWRLFQTEFLFTHFMFGLAAYRVYYTIWNGESQWNHSTDRPAASNSEYIHSEGSLSHPWHCHPSTRALLRYCELRHTAGDVAALIFLACENAGHVKLSCFGKLDHVEPADRHDQDLTPKDFLGRSGTGVRVGNWVTAACTLQSFVFGNTWAVICAVCLSIATFVPLEAKSTGGKWIKPF